MELLDNYDIYLVLPPIIKVIHPHYHFHSFKKFELIYKYLNLFFEQLMNLFINKKIIKK